MMTKNTDNGAHLFYPDVRAERLGRRPGGVPRDIALQRAQTAVDDMQSDFDAWLAHEFDALHPALAELGRNPGDTDAMQRAFHSAAQMRDVCGTMGYELVTFVARTLCDILEAYMAGAAHDAEVVECHVNAFALARQQQYRHLTPAEVPELARGLLRVAEITSIVPPKSGG